MAKKIPRHIQLTAEDYAASLGINYVITNDEQGKWGHRHTANAAGHLEAIGVTNMVAYCTPTGEWYTAPGWLLEPPQMLLF